jgi:uncharacterized protein YodC (DUF2158 family)
MEFNIGDTVQLKSGGPVMTVESREGNGSLWCVWFSTTKDGVSDVKGAAFKPSMLIEA